MAISFGSEGQSRSFGWVRKRDLYHRLIARDIHGNLSQLHSVSLRTYARNAPRKVRIPAKDPQMFEDSVYEFVGAPMEAEADENLRRFLIQKHIHRW